MTTAPARPAAATVAERRAADNRRYLAEIDALLADTEGQTMPRVYAVHRPGEPWRCGVAVEYKVAHA